jgi:hypothetical protein
MRLAIGHATLAAPAGLLFGFGHSEFSIDFVEIFVPQIGVTLIRHVAVDFYEFQHRLFCHAGIPLVS